MLWLNNTHNNKIIHFPLPQTHTHSYKLWLNTHAPHIHTLHMSPHALGKHTHIRTHTLAYSHLTLTQKHSHPHSLANTNTGHIHTLPLYPHSLVQNIHKHSHICSTQNIHNTCPQIHTLHKHIHTSRSLPTCPTTHTAD